MYYYIIIKSRFVLQQRVKCKLPLVNVQNASASAFRLHLSLSLTHFSMKSFRDFANYIEYAFDQLEMHGVVRLSPIEIEIN